MTVSDNMLTMLSALHDTDMQAAEDFVSAFAAL